MNFIQRLFTRKKRMYGVWLEIRHNNKCIHKYSVITYCKWKYQAKRQARNECTLHIGTVKKVQNNRP